MSSSNSSRPSTSGVRRSRKVISIETKMEVIRRKDKGQKNCFIGRAMGLAESTVRTILGKRADIEKCYKAYGCSGFDNRKFSDSVLLVKTERFLTLFIARKDKEGVPLDKKEIMDKARLFYKAVCKREGVPLGNFKASNGWLYRFLKRKGIRNIKLTGESRSANEVAAKDFPDVLKGIIEEGEYHPDAIYNMDEAGFQYKLMPKSTFLAKTTKQARGRKPDKVRLTVEFCVNLTGTHKMKPLVVHKVKHPRCYKHLSDMKKAPVYWKTSQKGWVTSPVMKDWFLNCFVPDARWKCRQDGREFKVLLTMDNCPAHPAYLQHLHPAVQVVFLPPNTTSVIQPLDQEIIANVKSRYQAMLFRDLRASTDSQVEVQQILYGDEDSDIDDEVLPDIEEDPDFNTDTPDLVTVHQFWRRFTVKNAIDYILQAWESISPATVRHGWRKLTPHLCADVDEGEVQSAAQALSDAVDAAREVPGFGEVTQEEILEVQAAGEQLTTDDIMDSATLEDRLQDDVASDEEEGGVVDEESTPSNKGISEILSVVDVLRDTVLHNEVCAIRKSEVINNLNKAFQFYNELYAQRLHERKQSLITRFIRPVQPSAESDSEPEPEPERDSELPSIFDETDMEDFEGFLTEVDVIASDSTPPLHGGDVERR